MINFIEYSDEVSEALKKGMPVVALESTIISHGMPFPENVEMAMNVEKIIRDLNVTPATIAIINGKIKIGLNRNEIEYLGKLGKKVNKASIRDLPYLVSKHLNGATTVAATSYLANIANIKIFATGGIGGVHRGAETSFDISNDLEAVANLPVTIVCAGAKSILDLEKTLEYLETKGVDVVGYQTDYLPAFYTSKSPYLVNHRLDSPEEIADLIKTKSTLGINSGLIIANPIPEEDAMDPLLINQAIDEALREIEKQHITSKDITPYLLEKIKTITKGDSLASNIKLIYNNAKLAAEIAKNL